MVISVRLAEGIFAVVEADQMNITRAYATHYHFDHIGKLASTQAHTLHRVSSANILHLLCAVMEVGNASQKMKTRATTHQRSAFSRNSSDMAGGQRGGVSIPGVRELAARGLPVSVPRW